MIEMDSHDFETEVHKQNGARAICNQNGPNWFRNENNIYIYEGWPKSKFTCYNS